MKRFISVLMICAMLMCTTLQSAFALETESFTTVIAGVTYTVTTSETDSIKRVIVASDVETSEVSMNKADNSLLEFKVNGQQMPLASADAQRFGGGEVNALPYWYRDCGYDFATNVAIPPAQDTGTWRMIMSNYYKTYNTTLQGRPSRIAYFLDGIDSMEQAQRFALSQGAQGVAATMAQLASNLLSANPSTGAGVAAIFQLFSAYAAAAPYINQCETYKNNLLMWWEAYPGY